MARGDFHPFDAFFLELGKGNYDFSTLTIKVGIVNSTLTPARGDTTPTWSDYSANEVSGTNYPAGGVTLDNVTWAVTSGIAKLDSDDETIAQSGTGFSNGYFGIVYETTGGNAIGWLDLGGPVGNVAEALVIAVPTNGWLRLGRSSEL
jgi:hypothetical protein